MTVHEQITIDIPFKKGNHKYIDAGYRCDARYEIVLSSEEKRVIREATAILGITGTMLMRDCALQIAHIILEKHNG